PQMQCACRDLDVFRPVVAGFYHRLRIVGSFVGLIHGGSLLADHTCGYPSPDSAPAYRFREDQVRARCTAGFQTGLCRFRVSRVASKLITIAYTFKTLTDDDRGAIYQALKGEPAAAVNADVGTKLPSGVELRPVPDEVAARVPQTRGYRYVVANGRVLLVGTSRIVMGVFADANAR